MVSVCFRLNFCSRCKYEPRLNGNGLDVPRPQPLPDEIFDERIRLPILQHPIHLRGEILAERAPPPPAGVIRHPAWTTTGNTRAAWLAKIHPPTDVPRRPAIFPPVPRGKEIAAMPGPPPSPAKHPPRKFSPAGCRYFLPSQRADPKFFHPVDDETRGGQSRPTTRAYARRSFASAGTFFGKNFS